jgi:hypothetical protein
MSQTENDTVTWIDYDYAIVRVVPQVHLCTFVNVGVVVHARTQGFLEARMGFDREKLQAVCSGLDIDLLDRFVDAYSRVCRGGEDAGPIGLLPPSERFHWLTAPRSGVLQTSEVHPGRCHDLNDALEKLLAEHCQPIGM